MTRKFEIEARVFAIVEIDDSVFDAVDNEWRSNFYPLHTPNDIAEHVGWNVGIMDRKLTMLDGWADQPEGSVRVIEDKEWYGILATEIDNEDSD